MLKSIFKSYFALIIGIITISLSFVDNIAGISLLTSYESRSSFEVLLFLTIIFITNMSGQIILLVYVIKGGFALSKQTKNFRTFSNFAIILSIGINILVFSSLLISSYETNSYRLSQFLFLIIFNLISSFIIIGILSYEFLSWLINNKNLLIFLYLLASIAFLIVNLSLIIWIIIQMQGRSEIISPSPNPWDSTSSRITIFFDVYRISSLIMFGFFWIATSMLLKSYFSYHSKRISKKKYWALVIAPLIYFVCSSDFVLNQFNQFIFQYPFLSNIIIFVFGASKQIGGIFFAIIFILISKKVSKRDLRNSLILSSAGIMMLFSSIQVSILDLKPYPVFGLNTLLIMPLSSYILLIGLYYSAQSIAFDKQFLTILKRNFKDKSSLFLESLGTAQWKKNIEGMIENVSKSEEMKKGLEYSGISSEDIDKHIQETIKELEKYKNESKKINK